MKRKQYGLKRIPGDTWYWIEREAQSRKIGVNEFIFTILDFARHEYRGIHPFQQHPAVFDISPIDNESMITNIKEQYCLRNIPHDIWEWVENESKASGTSLKEVIIKTLESVRCGITQKFLFNTYIPLPQIKPSIIPFTFIDLFAGIGGFRAALQGKLGGKCVFSSEWDRFCIQTYEHWYGERPLSDDIRNIPASSIPDHDLLVGGFPCQPFSIAGVSKKQSLGQKHGFDCLKQGNLFFCICDIVATKQPKAIILENVKNLQSHDKGNTWKIIKQQLLNLGYSVHSQIIDASDYVPQHRERIIIVGFRNDISDDNKDFTFPSPPPGPKPRIRYILEDNPDPKYVLTDHLWQYLQQYAEKHKLKGNGFGYGLTDLDGISRTLSARYYKDGSEILIPRRRTDPKPVDRNIKNPRRLTPVEAARLMGFNFVKDRDDIPVSDTQAYKQFGNAVVPDVIEAVAINVLEVLAQKEKNKRKKHETRVLAKKAKELLKERILEAV